jgi:plastocyanin
MKKIYLIIVLVLPALLGRAALYTINVGDFSFSPSTLSAECGDTIRWVWQSGTHSTTSLTIPGCASPWDAPINSTNTTFQMVLPPNCSGSFDYHCKFHPTQMTGVINVTCPVGINEIDANANLIFPNPFSDKLSVIYKGIDRIVIYDIIGNAVKEGTLKTGEITEFNVADLPRGTYFIRMFRNDSLVLTRKLSKI